MLGLKFIVIGSLGAVLKSGAGTAFYDAIDPSRRRDMEEQFKSALADGNRPKRGYRVVHDFILCVAGKEGRQ